MKILQLTPYPTSAPGHGGPIRCAAIAHALRDAGHDVKSLAIYVEQDHGPGSDDDIPFGRSSPYWREDTPFLSDYLSGVHAAADPATLAALTAVRDACRPDIIISEHPWLFAAAEKLVEGRDIPLVHSSHRIEYRLKERLLARASGSAHAHAALTAEIKAVEDHAAARADLVIACTETDAAYFRAEAAARNVVVAGNGVEPFSCAKSRVEGWRRYMARPFAAFVSSDHHHPDADGFWEMLAPGLAFLAPDEKILVSGSMGSILMQRKGARAFEAVNASRLEMIAAMDKTDRQAAMSASHLILLPVSEGAVSEGAVSEGAVSEGDGAPLATAEALESGRPIVGTSQAFRGFESAASLPHVHVIDDPRTFRRTVRALLDAPRHEGGTPLAIRSRFYWRQQMSAAISAIDALVPSGSAGKSGA